MKKIAHRGYKTSKIKENTMEAFINAQNDGFEGIEFDVRKTKDGVLVVCHDATIDRVSDGTGFIKDKTYEELSKYNFGSDDVPSKIVKFESVLGKFPDMLKLVELKVEVDLEPYLELIDERTYFMSFDNGMIKRLKKKHPKLKCGVLNYVLNSKLNFQADMVAILDMVATDEIVMSFLKRGIKVFIYGIVGKIDYKREYNGLYYIVEHKD